MDGMEVLQALCGSREPVGSRQLARELNMEATRVNRLLKTLAALGMARQTPDRKYLPGAGIHVLASQSLYASGLLHAALPVLEELTQTGCVVALGVLWRRHVSYIYHGREGQSAADAIGTRGLFPAESSGLGHVLLAQLSDATMNGLFNPREARSITQALKRVKTQDWALVRRAPEQGGEATFAVPLGRPAIAAVGLAGDLSLPDVDVLLPRLQKAVKTIEKKLR